MADAWFPLGQPWPTIVYTILYMAKNLAIVCGQYQHVSIALWTIVMYSDALLAVSALYSGRVWRGAMFHHFLNLNKTFSLNGFRSFSL